MSAQDEVEREFSPWGEGWLKWRNCRICYLRASGVFSPISTNSPSLPPRKLPLPRGSRYLAPSACRAFLSSLQASGTLFRGGCPAPAHATEPWWEFYVVLAVPLNVNPFSGEFRLFGLNRRGGRRATIYWRQLRFDKKLQRHGRPAAGPLASPPQPSHENPSTPALLLRSSPIQGGQLLSTTPGGGGLRQPPCAWPQDSIIDGYVLLVCRSPFL